MEMPVRQRPGTIILSKGMREMLAAVIAHSKGDVRNAHGTVDQEKSRLFQTLFVYILDNTASQKL